MPGRTAGAGAASRLSDTGSSRGNRHRRRPAHSTGANANATASAHARGVSGSASGRDDVAASGAHTVVPSRAEAPSHTTWSDLPDARDPQEVERINQRIQAIAGHPVFTGRDPVTGRRRRGGAAWHEAAQRAALPLSHTRGFHTGNSGDDYADGDALDDAQADADYNAALDAFYEHRYAQSRGDHARNSATTRRFDFDEPEWPDESDQENESDNTLAMNVEELRQRRARMFRAVREASGEGACGEVPLETAHNGNLQFHLVSCDGGDYGPKYRATNVLQNDRSVYCSQTNRNVNLLFRHGTEDDVTRGSFALHSMLIRAPSTGYTAPCREGLIFVSSSPITTAETRAFNDFDRETYLEWLAVPRQEELHAIEPVAYFSLANHNNYRALIEWSRRHEDVNATNNVIVRQRPVIRHGMAWDERQAAPQVGPLYGQYVMIKLLRSDSEVSGHDDGNIDLQFVGFGGDEGKRR